MSRDLLSAVVADSPIPGAVIAVARPSAPVQTFAFGKDAAGHTLAPEDLFTVASITKLATALVVLCLAQEGALDLDAPLARYLPSALAAQPGTAVRAFLCHTSGLPVDVSEEAAPYAPGLDWPALARACLATPLQDPPFTCVRYSNTGYGLLGLLVETVIAQPFPAALDSLVVKPLGIEAYFGVEPPRPPVTLADVRSSHTGTPLEPFNSRFWRSLAFPWGSLVTNAEGALRLALAFALPGLLQPDMAAQATRSQTGNLGGGFVPFVYPACPWGLGPDLRGHKIPHWAPASASPTSFGHTGASGCITWFDPVRRLGWSLLGTRTADNGWLLRRGSLIGETILANF